MRSRAKCSTCLPSVGFGVVSVAVRGVVGVMSRSSCPSPDGKVRRYVFPIQSEEAGSDSSQRKRLFCFVLNVVAIEYVQCHQFETHPRLSLEQEDGCSVGHAAMFLAYPGCTCSVSTVSTASTHGVLVIKRHRGFLEPVDLHRRPPLDFSPRSSKCSKCSKCAPECETCTRWTSPWSAKEHQRTTFGAR